MVKHNGRIVQLGFGAVGKSFYEKITKEIYFDEYKYYVITCDKDEFHAYINLGGIAANFIVQEITRSNWKEIFNQYLGEGDILIDFADSVGTRDFCEYCAEKNIMYLNTGETDWPDNWYNIFEENRKKRELQQFYKNSPNKNKYPIVLHHGNNPGLVSHFVQAGLDYIIHSQFKHNKHLNKLSKVKQYNEIAYELGVKMIHVNDIDLQLVKDKINDDLLISPWCIDSFWFEMLSNATWNVGTHEIIDESTCNSYDSQNGYFEFKELAIDKLHQTYYPHGKFFGHIVPHEETITIAQSLEVKKDNKVIYRPSVMFIYKPCEYAIQFLKNSKVDTLQSTNIIKETDNISQNDSQIIKGYKYPNNWEILYQEKIESGTEYVGVLIIGDKFDPVWVGNRIEMPFLYKNPQFSYWQTPTITPVAMSALSALCWMIKNKDKGGIYFPDDIKDYKYILNIAEKYISKTIYKTFKKNEIEKNNFGGLIW